MYLVLHDISGMAKPETSILYPGSLGGTLALGLQISLQGHSHYHVTSLTFEIKDNIIIIIIIKDIYIAQNCRGPLMRCNISEMVEDKDIVTMEIIYGL